MLKSYRNTVWVRTENQGYYPFKNYQTANVPVAVSTYDRISEVTPNIKALKASGLPLPVNPMELRKRTSTAHTVATTEYEVTTGRINGTSVQLAANFCPSRGIGDLPSDFIVDVESRAADKFRAKSEGAGANFGVMMAEAGQTADLLRNAVEGLVAVWHGVRRGDITGVVQWLGLDVSTRATARAVREARDRIIGRDIAGAWLALQFGWKPMVHDIYDIAQLLHEQVMGGRPMARVTSRVNATHFQDLSSVGPGRTVSGGWKCDYVVKYSANVYVQDPGSYLWSQTGLTNPALIAWELVPFSFVLDWLLPIGDMLERMTALDGLALTGGYKVIRASALSVTNSAFTHVEGAGTQTIGSPGLLKTTDFMYKVEKVESFPSFNDGPLKWRDMFDTESPMTRLFNVIGLIAMGASAPGFRPRYVR